VLAPRFDEVLAILGAAKPEILIDDRAILSALEAHPEANGYDHLKAAHRVVAWVHDPCGGPEVASAPRLLWSVLDKQAAEARGERGERPAAPRARRPDRPAKPWEGALRRAMDAQQADPEPGPVSA
jgi:nucleoid-associated protein YgaU